MASNKSPTKPFLVVVTGLSGAGMSSAVNALQDNGFYCIDNLPMELIWNAVELIESGKIKARGFAFVMDIRDARFAAEFPSLKVKLAERLKLDVLFLTASESVLNVRYGSTRRKHPLLGTKGNLQAAIRREIELLEPVEKAADAVLDTSAWSAQQLARTVESRYYSDLPPRSLYLTIVSFGFKYGQLRPVDLQFDVRFLSNPYFVPELRDKTGLDKDVREHVMAFPAAKLFYAKLEDMHRFLLPQYFAEGRHYLRVGIGCSGGRHRSVTMTELLAESLGNFPIEHVVVNVMHRDIDLPA